MRVVLLAHLFVVNIQKVSSPLTRKEEEPGPGLPDAETDGDHLSHISFGPELPPAAIIARDEARAAAVGEAVH